MERPPKNHLQGGGGYAVNPTHYRIYLPGKKEMRTIASGSVAVEEFIQLRRLWRQGKIAGEPQMTCPGVQFPHEKESCLLTAEVES